MKWHEAYTPATEPALEQIAAYIGNPLWGELRAFMEGAYGVTPQVQYSGCGGAPGWNVKYRKSGRALCTLYPDKGEYTCLVCIGLREEQEAELALLACTDYTRELFHSVKPLNGSRWLMLQINSPERLEDAKRLIAARLPPKATGKK